MPFPPEHIIVVMQVWLCILHTLQVGVEFLPEAFGVLELQSIEGKTWIEAALKEIPNHPPTKWLERTVINVAS